MHNVNTNWEGMFFSFVETFQIDKTMEINSQKKKKKIEVKWFSEIVIVFLNVINESSWATQ